MSLIARFSGPKAAAQTVHTAEKAQQAGFVDVQTHYEPPTGQHSVTGSLPEQAATRTVDSILGR
ncbi:hypothetical protein [Kitasatospora sp. NPDC057223]|uniref:hypothetical protein n=1 Tax=Kitasatospora sp. NPDC057223 TaxID=3346055 RepID=UPI003630B825